MTTRYSRQDATILGIVMILLGFAAIGFGWAGAAATPFVPTQLTYTVSGSLTGIALIGTGAAMLNAQANRIASADRSHALDNIIDEAVEVLQRLKG